MWLLGSLTVPSSEAADNLNVGVAQVDITPDYPVRLSGFGFRRTESEGITLRVYAKALAFGNPTNVSALLITVDNLCVPNEIVEAVARRLEAQLHLRREHLTVTATHTHTAPMLTGVAPTLFSVPIPPEHQAHIDRYTREFTDQLVLLALQAARDIQPARISWGIGNAGFAINRRTKGGPVDHDLPALVIKDLQEKVRAVYFSYACHCVTLSNNKISGDWAGYAQDAIQRAFPGAVALASVGCGADSNPSSGVTGDSVAKCADQGNQIAEGIKALLPHLKPVTVSPNIKFARLDIPFDEPRTRAQWEERAQSKDAAVAYHAQVTLAKLDHGETLPAAMNYVIQTWLFGDHLAMVFLPGETVVDYSLRLKKEFDRTRLWVNGYSNEGRCYVPSERVLKEGGYEGGDAMIYYDRPNRFAPGLEQKIIDAVHAQVPAGFVAPKGTEGTRPLSAIDSLQHFKTAPGLKVELVAAEPLVVDPVAIDWAADGKLWVAEMLDYPMGLDGKWQPGGRVKFLEDTNGDGTYDKATIFLENLPFPTGVTAWGRGVLVCAAPDVIFAEDTDGDGKADKIRKIFSGFATENYQARVNSLSLGLDNWIYGANGLLGGVIHGMGTPLVGNAPASTTTEINIRGHDFRFNPFGGVFEPVSGLTQQGRVRDDWGRWYGCNNSEALLHFPLTERYANRNPAAPSLAASIFLPRGKDPNRLYPTSRLHERFNDPDQANRVTSGCGLGLYRDTLLGESFYGNAFTAEPVHNLVHREVIEQKDGALTSHRAIGEEQSEFLSSTDNWCRPVQVRTGPDGALYVVDMYRFLIEHPRWIPATRLTEIDVRAGSDRGRIYRVVKDGVPLRPFPNLASLTTPDLAETLNSPNGTERDRAHLELLFRKDPTAAEKLAQLATTAALPQVRLQAWSALSGLRPLSEAEVTAALADPSAEVRSHALQWSEPFLQHNPSLQLAAAVLNLANDSAVLPQLALTLGEWKDRRAGEALSRVARTHAENTTLRHNVLSSATPHAGVLLATISSTQSAREWTLPLLATVAASGTPDQLATAVNTILKLDGAAPETFEALAVLLEGSKQRNLSLEKVLADLGDATASAGLKRLLERSRTLALEPGSPQTLRSAAFQVIIHGPQTGNDTLLLGDLAIIGKPDSVRIAALNAVRSQRDPKIAERILSHWKEATPAVRVEVLNLLFSRTEWTRQVLDATTLGTIQSAEISPIDRQRLLASNDHAIKTRAAELFTNPEKTPKGEGMYASLDWSKGQANHGRELFTAHCSACHSLAGIGHAVGPDLAPLHDKEPDYFVQNILNPNAVIEPRFLAYEIETADDRSLTGIIRAENAATITLVMGNGLTETVSKSGVKTIKASKLSLMPEGLQALLPAPEMVDLIAFLKSSGSSKKFPGNKPEKIVAAATGVLTLPAAKAEIYGKSAAFEPDFKNIGFWASTDDLIAWNAEVTRAGSYDVYLDYACSTSAAGDKFAFQAANEVLSGKVHATGSDWSNYQQIKIGSIKLDSGQLRITMRSDGPVHEALIDLRTVALVPVGTKSPWPAQIATENAVLRDPVTIARFILDQSQPNRLRENAINSNPQFASELITELTRNITDTTEEYRRIPWIWRVAVASGRRNEANQMKRVLQVSMPKPGEPLRDWQAVVIGGGIINGIADRQNWPGDRVAETLSEDKTLAANLQRVLELATAMAEDEKVAAGTRYDALRIIGIRSWNESGALLSKYLLHPNAELQMGAVSALVDMKGPESTRVLLDNYSALTKENRRIALTGLIRTETRAGALLTLLESGAIPVKDLSPAQLKELTEHSKSEIRTRAAQLAESAR
jgi:putative membrane-bound dehydrogenase-like protein